jgi:FkbM family methyltransferase
MQVDSKRNNPGRRKTRGGQESFSPYWSAVLALAGVCSRLRVCIVGANDGKFGDPVFRLIRDSLADQTDIVLFEPQPYLIPYLSETYAFHPSHHIVNAAVGPASELVLYAILPEAWEKFSPAYAKGWPVYRGPTGITSSERQLVLDWVSQHAPQESDPGALVTELRVPCSRLPDALECLGQGVRIDVLQVDVEGFDDEAIYACDLDRTCPSIIYFEENHLPAARRSRLREYLEPNYRLVDVKKRDVLAIRRHRGDGVKRC